MRKSDHPDGLWGPTENGNKTRHQYFSQSFKLYTLRDFVHRVRKLNSGRPLSTHAFIEPNTYADADKQYVYAVPCLLRQHEALELLASSQETAKLGL